MASSGCRMAPDGSGTQQKESKGFTEIRDLAEEHDRFSSHPCNPLLGRPTRTPVKTVDRPPR